MVVVLFGVSGSGKTTVGIELARQLAWNFHDADTYHSPESKEKMRAGIPLTDDHRWPWLDMIRAIIRKTLTAKEGAVVACSALARRHRDYLREPGVEFVYLRGKRGLIRAILESRSGHFFDPGLLASQFEVLEEPAEGVVVDVDQPVESVVSEILARLQPAAPTDSPSPSRSLA